MNDSHKNSDNQTIFIQIASYRDEELPKTITSCLENAKSPKRLHFGIVNQFDKATQDYLNKYKNDSRFKINNIPWRDSRGVGIARNLCNQLYDDENFTLQIDSHMRFITDWDEKLIEEWQKCYNLRAILSSYPPEYKYEKGKEVFINLEPSMLVVRKFDYGFIPVFKSHPLAQQTDRPRRANFACGGFMFSVGKVCQEVPYCKEICFTGEEIIHSLRLFTFGYRVYSPVNWVLYHLYDRPNSKRFWHDFHVTPKQKEIYDKMSSVSDNRVRSILLENDTSMLGSFYSLIDFENYSGINFKEKLVHPDQLAGMEPPYETGSSWIDNVSPLKMMPISITINTSTFDMTLDYDFWYFGLHDKDENELVREDIIEDDWNVDSIEIKKEYFLRTPPSKYIIWPHSKSKGWLERKVYVI